jgi:RNA polymerase sigma-70 factor (ECF subfamily)
LTLNPPPWETVSWEELSARARVSARRHARHPDDAEDIAQEALIRAWTHRDSLRDRDRLAGWLARIVRNEAARDASRRRPEPTLADPHAAADDEGISAVAGRADLGRCLRRLEADERLLLHLRYAQDLTQATIARSLNLPEGTVKVRLHRARGKLRGLLNES